MTLKQVLVRRQTATPWKRIAIAGVGSTLTIAALALVAETSALPLLAAAFGASSVLVFTMPESPLSQPVNLVCGHLIGAGCGLLVAWLLPHAWWSIGIGVGATLVVMTALRVTHPPAGGTPIVVITTHAIWSQALLPILVGTLVVLVAGVLVHRLTGTRYPLGVYPGRAAVAGPGGEAASERPQPRAENAAVEGR